jgi:hypothetical protein
MRLRGVRCRWSRWEAVCLLAALGTAFSASLARADVQPDARPIQYQNCALGGASGGASKIATGGTPVTVSQTNLRGIFIQNPSTATESLFVSVTATPASTTAGVSIEVMPGNPFTEGPGTIGSLPITINAATTNHAFTCVYGQ